MIIMNPYVFLESHRGHLDRIFNDAVKNSELATQRSPIPNNELVFQIDFEPSLPQDLENELKWFLENKLDSLKEVHKGSVVYDELIVYPLTICNATSGELGLSYKFTFMIKYA